MGWLTINGLSMPMAVALAFFAGVCFCGGWLSGWGAGVLAGLGIRLVSAVRERLQS